MELKLKDDSKNRSEKEQNDGFGGIEDTISPSPVVIKFDEVHAPVEVQKNSYVGILIRVSVFIILAVVLMIIYKNVIKPRFATTDITDYVKSDEATIVNQLKLRGGFEPDSAWCSRLPIFKDVSEGITVTSNGGIAIIYKNNKQFGIAIDSKRYKLFGVEIGIPEYSVDDSITFTYDDEFFVLNDLADTSSTSNYYYNTKTNELLAVTANGNSNRVVAVTYFYNGRFFTDALDNISE